MLHTVESPRWRNAIKVSQELMRVFGEEVYVGEWQALKGGEKDPRMTMWELNNVILSAPIPATIDELQQEVKPNLPWAEDHFQERVGGEPLNPGEQYKNWPWYRGNVEEHKEPGQFSHTYMERFWPKYARSGKGPWGTDGHMNGIHYPYGDLNDVVSQLQHSPGTRQAYLPVWFPEDTGAVQQQRVPCSLGYHFLLRAGRLHCSYFIRSCDFFRHFRDDVYLAGRLTQWIINQLTIKEAWQGATEQAFWGNVSPGDLTMHIVNLHCFAAEKERLK